MRKSKLEMDIDILSVLAENEGLSQTHLMSRSNVNRHEIKEQLDFLTQNGLVETKTLENGNTVYFITARGTEILRSFVEIKQVFPLEAETKQAAILF
jgi:predicted transcriptional regulator